MSKIEFKLSAISLTIFIVFSIEFFIQNMWIKYLQILSIQRIDQCVTMPNINATACLIEYIGERNDMAFESINSYLVSIAIIVLVSIFRFFVFFIKNRKHVQH